MSPVLAAAARAQREHGCHVEIVTNVIPAFNDDERTLRGIASWISTTLGQDTPWHVTRFTPYLEYAHISPTPIRTLESAVRIGRDAGLRFVYLGNVPGHEGENTVCPNCKRLLVRRTGYAVEDVALRGTLCAMCGENVNFRTALK
jgi:pyruvate formate lyase activating enzyme